MGRYRVANLGQHIPYPGYSEDMEKYKVPPMPAYPPAIYQQKHARCVELRNELKRLEKIPLKDQEEGRMSKTVIDYMKCLEDLKVELAIINRTQVIPAPPDYWELNHEKYNQETPTPPSPNPRRPEQEPPPGTPTPTPGSPLRMPSIPELGPLPFANVTPMTATPVANQSASSFAQECPPGQFPEYPGGPCRGAVATGGLPGLPGGFGAADVATGMPTAPGVAYGSMGIRYPVIPMRGYAPFLGQIRPRRLGQRVPMVPYGEEPAPLEGCERVGYNQSAIMEPELEAKMAAVRAAGRSLVPMPTGRTINPGTRSETQEVLYWSCPMQYAKTEGLAPKEEPAITSPIPSSEDVPPLVYVAGAVAGIGLIAWLASNL